jgi:hypothetical protein
MARAWSGGRIATLIFMPVISTMRSSPSASRDCLWPSSRGPCGTMAIRPIFSDGSSKLHWDRRNLIAASSVLIPSVVVQLDANLPSTDTVVLLALDANCIIRTSPAPGPSCSAARFLTRSLAAIDLPSFISSCGSRHCFRCCAPSVACACPADTQVSVSCVDCPREESPDVPETQSPENASRRS